jgi:hypothetical protein
MSKYQEARQHISPNDLGGDALADLALGAGVEHDREIRVRKARIKTKRR